MSQLLALLLSSLAIFLVLLVLVQRGRGGGLAGALGGMGGSSAFGAKAGDIFTRITIITASIWIFFCLIALFWSKHHGDVLGKRGGIIQHAANHSADWFHNTRCGYVCTGYNDNATGDDNRFGSGYHGTSRRHADSAGESSHSTGRFDA